MTAPESKRRPPGQEKAPRSDSENGSPISSSVGPAPDSLNGARASLRPTAYIAPCAERIPAELKPIGQWVAWRYELRLDCKTGELKPTKVPVDAKTGRNASSTNPRTWATFETAWSRHERDGLDGVGFVLTRELGVVGIDIDHCRDPETGVIDDDALAVVREIDSYTEVSPSGTGIRIFALGRLPAGWRKRGRYEVYEHSRYLTVTGLEVP